MSQTHRHEALAHLDDAQVAMLALDELLATDWVEDRSSKIREAHNAIGRSLKLAQIHSHLAIAEAIAPAVAVEPWAVGS